MSHDAGHVVGTILVVMATVLMAAIIWFRWNCWEDRP